MIIAPWRPQLPDWEFYLAQPEYVARSTKWARGEIWADRWERIACRLCSVYGSERLRLG